MSLPRFPRAVLFSSADREKALDYSLVLSSQGFQHWLRFDGSAYHLVVEEAALERAREVLDDYERENAEFADAGTQPLPLEISPAPLAVLMVPVITYFAVALHDLGFWCKERGLADSDLILAGQWWRTLTALTLHADAAHFLGNLVSGYFILNLLVHRLGLGTLMLWLTLVSGATNWFVAWYAYQRHLSLGFSTFVFAALGLLAAIESRHWRAAPGRSLRRVTPLLSAFFLAVLMGLGENADVRAHFFGLLFGAASGLAFYRKDAHAPPSAQWIMTALSYGVFMLAWALALR